MDPTQGTAGSSDDPSRAFPLLIVGLGNPGERYERTRHNAGFLVLEQLRQATGRPWVNRGDWEQAAVPLGGEERALIRPLTYMNRSGQPLLLAMSAGGSKPRDILVIADDVYLPLGRIRLRRLGSPGGHNGLASICELLDTQSFARLKVGVGPFPPAVDLAEFVLEPLAGEAWTAFHAAVRAAAEAVGVICRDGLEVAMNQFHAPPELRDDPS